MGLTDIDTDGFKQMGPYVVGLVSEPVTTISARLIQTKAV